MRATVLRGSSLQIEEVEMPTPGPGEVLIAPERSGLCPSGVAAVTGDSTWGYTDPVGFPGHEFSGDVIEVGDGVSHVSPGERVVADLELRCGTCAYCRSGRENLCPDRSGLGYFSHAEYVKAVGDQTYRVPDSVNYEAAAFTEPLSCVLHSVSNAGLPRSGTVLVVGAGQMGLLHLKLLRSLSNADVIVTDLREDRRARAERFGADLVCSPADDLETTVREFTDDEPLACAFVTVGNTTVQEETFALLDRGAPVVLYAGIHADGTPTLDIDPNRIHYGERSVVGSNSKTGEEFIRALEMIGKGDLGVTDLVTDRLPLSEIDRGVRAVSEQETIKTMITPQE